ncbi:MAG: hypothetical protein SAMD01599839_07390 [Rectinema sp.]
MGCIARDAGLMQCQGFEKRTIDERPKGDAEGGHRQEKAIQRIVHLERYFHPVKWNEDHLYGHEISNKNRIEKYLRYAAPVAREHIAGQNRGWNGAQYGTKTDNQCIE